jgi:hypothetical protein
MEEEQTFEEYIGDVERYRHEVETVRHILQKSTRHPEDTHIGLLER